MKLVIFKNFSTKEEKDKWNDFSFKYGVYKYINLIQYTLTISDIKYVLRYNSTKDEITPYREAYTLQRILNITHIDSLLTYLENNAEEEIITDVMVDGSKPIPIIEFSKSILFFLLDGDSIVSFVQTSKFKKNYLHIDYVKSYVENKGYCKAICIGVLRECRLNGVKQVSLESEGGIGGHKCYINAFLLSEEGFDYVEINDISYGGDVNITLNRESSKDWIKNLPIRLNYDDSYNMKFF